MKKFLVLSSLSLFSFFLCGLFFYNSDFSSKLKSSEFLKNTKNFSFSRTFTFSDDDVVGKTEEKVFDLKDISGIKIDATTATISIRSRKNLTDQVVFKVKTYSDKSVSKFEALDNHISLSLREKGKNITVGKTAKINMYLPRDSKKLDLTIDLSFGETKLKNINFNNLVVDIAAGSFEGKRIKMSDAAIKVSAGEVELEDTYFETLNSTVDGGSAEIEVLNPSPVASISTSAGQIEFKVGKKLKKNFTLKAKTSFGKTNLVEGYEEKSDGTYVYGEGKGKVVLKADLGEINVF